MSRQSKWKRGFAHALRVPLRGAGGRWRARAPFVRTTKELLSLAWPIAVAMGGETLMGLVDTKLVGGLGAEALGGVGVGISVAWLGYMTIFGVMRGVKVCVAHAVGDGREEDAASYARAGVGLGLAAGTLVWACTRNVAPLLRSIGVESSLVPYASVFLASYTLGAPASSVVSALTQHRQAAGDSRTPMAMGLLGNVVNALLGWSLIYGHFGLPALGVQGSALATAASEWLEALAMLGLFLRDSRRPANKGPSRAQAPPLSRALREVAQIGIPTGIQFGSESLAFVTFTAVLGTLGAEQVAAHQIALATLRTSFLPGAAIAEACSVLVAQALGRRAIADADRATRAALTVAVGFMATCGVVFALDGGALARAFTADPAVVRVARTLLGIGAAFQVLDATYMVFRGALRGARDVRVPALICIGSIWVCVPTAAILLGRGAGWGAVGGWCGFLGETTFGATLLAIRWRKGAWRAAYAGGAGGVGNPSPVLDADLSMTAGAHDGLLGGQGDRLVLGHELTASSHVIDDASIARARRD